MSGIVERLRDEANLCRCETAEDVAGLLDEAANEIERLRAHLARAEAAIREHNNLCDELDMSELKINYI